VIAVGRHLSEVVIPLLAWVLAELWAVLLCQHVPGTNHVLGRERFAVVPFDTGLQFERHGGLVGIPRPALGKVGNDRVHAVARLVLLEHDEVIVDAHEWNERRDRRLFVDGGAGCGVTVVDAQGTAGLLGQRVGYTGSATNEPENAGEQPAFREPMHVDPPC
jgi:hypothetical protein